MHLNIFTVLSFLSVCILLSCVFVGIELCMPIASYAVGLYCPPNTCGASALVCMLPSPLPRLINSI